MNHAAAITTDRSQIKEGLTGLTLTNQTSVIYPQSKYLQWGAEQTTTEMPREGEDRISNAKVLIPRENQGRANREAGNKEIPTDLCTDWDKNNCNFLPTGVTFAK